jgi:hypothetical protein
MHMHDIILAVVSNATIAVAHHWIFFVGTNLIYTEKIQDLCLLWETVNTSLAAVALETLHCMWQEIVYYVMFAVLHMVCTLRSFKVFLKIWVDEHVIANPIPVSILSQKLCMKSKFIIFYDPVLAWSYFSYCGVF